MQISAVALVEFLAVHSSVRMLVLDRQNEEFLIFSFFHKSTKLLVFTALEQGAKRANEFLTNDSVNWLICVELNDTIMNFPSIKMIQMNFSNSGKMQWSISQRWFCSTKSSCISEAVHWIHFLNWGEKDSCEKLESVPGTLTGTNPNLLQTLTPNTAGTVWLLCACSICKVAL